VDTTPRETDDRSELAVRVRARRRRRRHRRQVRVLGVFLLVAASAAGIAIAPRWHIDSAVDAKTVWMRNAQTVVPADPPTTTSSNPASIATTEPAPEEPQEPTTAPPTAEQSAPTVAPQPPPIVSESAPEPAPSEPVAPAPVLAPLAPTPAPQPGPAGLAGDILAAINRDRAANGLGPLGWHSGLASYAQSWANWMAQNTSLGHQDLSPFFSLGFQSVGENVLSAPPGSSAAAIEATWMGSSQHRANILNGAFTAAGVGTATSADGRIWVAVDFGG
jgi:uncharacterized protein YkwD